MNLHPNSTAQPLTALSANVLPVYWTPVMVAILQENYLRKTDHELRSLICVGIKEIRRKMKELNLVRPIEEAPKIGRPRKGPEEKAPKKERTHRPVRERDILARERAVKHQSRMYKTKKVDYSQMKLVRIDSKTSILVPADRDPAEAKELFYVVNKGYNKSKDLLYGTSIPGKALHRNRRKNAQSTEELLQ